ncbi:MAG: nucleoside triphosphate pyrophosphohydrolase [Eggerthellaceae bacterium]
MPDEHEPEESPHSSDSFGAFVHTIARLRAPGGCPWDRAQTHESIAHNMVEEAYEAVDAIERGDTKDLREELGDVLLQVVLQSQIAADAGEFTIEDVCWDINAKMIRRHPHVFGEDQAENANDVLGIWEKVKLEEKRQSDTNSSLLDSVPPSFPALMQAQKVSRKAASVGFDWDSVDGVWDKVFEEVDELKDAYRAAPQSSDGKLLHQDETGQSNVKAQDEKIAAVEMEFGDLLFSLVNAGRKMGIDAETALRDSTRKFRQRWAFMERQAESMGKAIDELSSEQLEALWVQAKQEEDV